MILIQQYLLKDCQKSINPIKTPNQYQVLSNIYIYSVKTFSSELLIL